TGAWQLYTEGWAATALTAWSDSDPNFYFCGGEGSNIWAPGPSQYKPEAALQTLCSDLLNANYTSLAQRQSWFENATRLSLLNGVRVWVTSAHGAVHAHSGPVFRECTRSIRQHPGCHRRQGVGLDDSRIQDSRHRCYREVLGNVHLHLR